MHLYIKVKAVERLFRRLSAETEKFQAASNLRCITGCSKCCSKPDIEATALEFLPFAYAAFKAGKAEELFFRLKEDDSTMCPIYLPFTAGSGGCSAYAHRGLICRLFGYAAVTNKHGDRQLIACKPLKDAEPAKIAAINSQINGGMKIPLSRDYYYQLMSIDHELGSRFYPINTAIMKALEIVLSYYAYRPRRAG